ncbi:MAG: PEGA domain-containing protein [Nitrospirales bacterium]
MRRTIGVLLLCGLGAVTGGCGTIVNGFHQDVAVTSSPGGAEVSVDGVAKGTTPIVASLWRGSAHVVKVEQPGYHPIETSVVPTISVWEWGNVISWNFLGVAIDAWTGGMYALSQDKVTVVFATNPDKKLVASQETVK